jgi:membrane protein implicated in regulation of membrane protease activity
MTWAGFYLVCFLVGLVLSLVSFLGGSAHFHLPHLAGHHAGLPGAHGGHGGMRSRGSSLSPINFATITAFLAWFGGTGYLMSHYWGVWFLLGLGVASASGLAGAAAIFWFVAKVLVSPDENLDPADYEMVGVLGRITNPIRAGGTGEMIFSQQGTRRTTGVRSEDGTAVAKGVDVVVTRYEKGIAYVRPWESITGAGERTDHDR